MSDEERMEPLRRMAGMVADVSPGWRESVSGEPRGERRSARHARGMPALVAAGIEAIYEGWALHAAVERVRVLEPHVDPDRALLLGDWCYAAGLCDVADAGDLEAVSELAALVADVSTMPAHSGDGPDPREQRWDESLDRLATRPT